MTKRRISIVTAQLLGYDRTGGVGTATSFLALALSRSGHAVEILYAGEAEAEPNEEWQRIYSEAGVCLRTVRRAHTVEPRRLRRPHAVALALREDVPDVVIAHEFGAPAYAAQRLRQQGLAFQGTLFVVFCHGTRRWVKEMNANARVSEDVLAESQLERTSIELADVVVSPSAYMIEWMRAQDWRLPEHTFVIPLLTRGVATGERLEDHGPLDRGSKVERLVFFGRLEERKGIEPFIAGLNLLGTSLLEGIDLEWLGAPTKHWTPDRVRNELSRRTKRALRSVAFETALDQPEALDRLRRPGTFVVMPSLGENSPNAVYECLELGVPFLASTVGGARELIAPEDWERALADPNGVAIATALRRALSDDNRTRPVRAAFDPEESLARWNELVESAECANRSTVNPKSVEVIVVHRASGAALDRCLAAIRAQTYLGEIRLIVAGERQPPEVHGALVVSAERDTVEAARDAGLRAALAPWVLFLDEDDVPEPGLVDALVRAQSATGADVVTCGIREENRLHLFAGAPGGLGVLGNDFGTVALVRRALLLELQSARSVEGDVDWPLLAGLAASGAHMVSIPVPLVTTVRRPGRLDSEPGNGLLVVEDFERMLPRTHRSLARLAAGLAADAARHPAVTPIRGKPRAFSRLTRRFS